MPLSCDWFMSIAEGEFSQFNLLCLRGSSQTESLFRRGNASLLPTVVELTDNLSNDLFESIQKQPQRCLMASVPSSQSLSRHHTYSRKQKSLGLLCTNFLSLYNRTGVETIGLDDAASQLGVERRRLYDIVNVLESVGVLSRKGKNSYAWNGFAGIPRALNQLKEEGLGDNFKSCLGDANVKDEGSRDSFTSCLGDTNIIIMDRDDEDERPSSPNTGSQSKRTEPTPNSQSSASCLPDNRREKSLGLLAQNFVKLFLCSDMDIFSLDDIAKLLLGNGSDPSIMRTKVRRLYDIANVLSSLHLIKKTHTTDIRKPAFRWLGIEGYRSSRTVEASCSDESHKRKFGTDITNASLKIRDLSVQTDSSAPNKKFQSQMKQDKKIIVVDSNIKEQDHKSYRFGPFAPVTISKGKLPRGESIPPRTPYDLENLASTYRPRYVNHAFQDLFGHYKEAWESWNSEVARKDEPQQKN